MLIFYQIKGEVQHRWTSSKESERNIGGGLAKVPGSSVFRNEVAGDGDRYLIISKMFSMLLKQLLLLLVLVIGRGDLLPLKRNLLDACWVRLVAYNSKAGYGIVVIGSPSNSISCKKPFCLYEVDFIPSKPQPPRYQTWLKFKTYRFYRCVWIWTITLVTNAILGSSSHL